MDPTTAAGNVALVFKLGLFAVLVRASHRATRAARESGTARPEAPDTPTVPLRDAA